MSEENQRIADPELLPSLVCTSMMRLGTRMATLFDQYFASLGLTQAQFRTLIAIAEEERQGGIAPSELAHRLLLDRASVTLMVNRMVGAGWVERRPGENRRTHRLVLTESGCAQLKGIAPHAIALADHTLAHLSGDELIRLAALLDRLEERLRDADPRTELPLDRDTEKGETR